MAWLTNDIVAWFSRLVILPLAPFLVGALARIIIRGKIQISVLDPKELAFSMAMLCLLVSLSANKLSDEKLAQRLTSNYSLGLFVFSALFTISVILTEIPSTIKEIDVIKSYELTRIFVLSLSIITIIGAIVSKHKHKLEDISI